MKTKKLTAKQYQEIYCKERCMRTRTQLYVAPDMHEAVMETARLFKKSHVTAVSLVDAILREHFNLHREMIEKERQSYGDDFMKFLDTEDGNERSENIGSH